MSKIVERPHIRVLLAFVSYLFLTVIVAFIHSFAVDAIPSNAKGLLALFGPVLALGTHMSVFLWIPLSIPLVALAVIGAIHAKTQWMTAGAFVISWLSMGWYLKDLF